MMNKNGQNRNFQKELDQILLKIAENNEKNGKKSLLLHACCGPCSSYVLEYLVRFFDITVYYYNPNIYPEAEYNRRFEELKKLYTQFPPALEGKVKVVEKVYNPEDFYAAVKTRENPELALEPEKGERCRRCYEFRLKASYDYACENHFDYFCTTLSISPFKDADKLNMIGEALTENGKGPQWLTSDFKKKNGFKRSLAISEEYGMYRQDYCGCIYSKQNKKND